MELDSEGSIVSTCIKFEFEEHVCKVEMPLFLFVKLKFSVYGRRQTNIHTRFAMQSASVGLAQARPNYRF